MMRLNKIITLTFFYLFLGCSQTVAWGQTINGKIIDDKQLPIDGATIILQTMDSTYIGASISNADGIFVFKSQQEEYRLIIQHLLYETKQMTGKGNDAGIIQLQPKDYALDEVIIKAERPFVKVENGLLGYNLAVLTQNQLVNNAYEALTKIPGVQEDRGILTLAGAGKLTVILNGKPTTMDAGQLETILRNTPVNRVEKAEVMYSAPPEYHVRGAVINLVYIPNNKSADVRLAHLWFAMGNIAAAQNVAFNSLFALNGYNPTMLQMLVRIELMRGNYLVALKYITLLEKTVHYAGWATAQRRFLFDDEAVEQDPSLGTGRASFPLDDSFVLLASPMDDLYKIVAVNPANSNAMQYALAYLLLAKDFNHVQSFVDTYYGTPALQYLAEPVQEALLFFSDYYHTLEEDYALRHGISNEQLSAYQQVDWEYCKAHGVESSTLDRFVQFKKGYEQVRQGAPRSLLDGFKHTFWYYLLFAEIG